MCGPGWAFWVWGPWFPHTPNLYFRVLQRQFARGLSGAAHPEPVSLDCSSCATPPFLECYHSFQRIYNGGGKVSFRLFSPEPLQPLSGHHAQVVLRNGLLKPLDDPCHYGDSAACGTQRRRLLLTTALEVGQKPPAGSQSLCTTDSTAVSVYTMEGRLFACSTGGNPNLENQKRVLKSLHRNIHPAWGAPSNRKVVQSTLGTGTKSEPERCS